MATHLRAIDKEFEEADDTGVLVLSGRNLRQFPTVPGELLDFADVFDAGWLSLSLSLSRSLPSLPPLCPSPLLFKFTSQLYAYITEPFPF